MALVGAGVPPNDPDQLPGRLQRLHISEGENAGPVNCIRWFGLKIVNSPVSFPTQRSASLFLVHSYRSNLESRFSLVYQRGLAWNCASSSSVLSGGFPSNNR